jgi:hypothetical protein
MMMERVGDRKKIEGYCSTGQSPQRAVVPVGRRRRIINERYYEATAMFLMP